MLRLSSTFYEPASDAGSPDGLFVYQKRQFYYTFKGLGMKKFDMLHGHLVHCRAIWYFLSIFYIFIRFGLFVLRKIWQPCSDARRRKAYVGRI
jgi:hypothetical protein